MRKNKCPLKFYEKRGTNMNAFHMYWNPSQEERNFNDYTILTMILSALQWKAINGGHLSFYGDQQTVTYLERLHLAELWDQCNGTILDQKIDRNHYNVSVFYTIGKFIALLQESCPCAMLDTDLIIWKDISSFLKEKEVAFTHWEDTKANTIWYCSKEKLPIPQGYQFHPKWDFKRRAANTSFMYFNQPKLRDYYAECAMRYMWNNPCTEKAIGNAGILFAEQRLFTMCIDERGNWKKTAPLLDITWNAKKGKFQISKNLPDGWEFFQPDNHNIATHTWIAKAQIDKNETYRTYFCCRLIEKICAISQTMEKTLVSMTAMQPYFRLLDLYGTTEQMLNQGIVTRQLYEET